MSTRLGVISLSIARAGYRMVTTAPFVKVESAVTPSEKDPKPGSRPIRAGGVDLRWLEFSARR
jgi:hypothetical protein